MKTCSTCKEEKDDSQFPRGHKCKDCVSKWRKEAYRKYKEAAPIEVECRLCKTVKDGKDFVYGSKICIKCDGEKKSDRLHPPSEDSPKKICVSCGIEKEAKAFRNRSKKCKECAKKVLYEWRKENPEKFKETIVRYRHKPDYREKQNEYKREKYNNDLNYKLRMMVRNRVRIYFKSGTGKTKNDYQHLTGCSYDCLRLWLEFNMTPEMNWENYGSFWHVDHTMPCAKFDLTKEENQLICFHWSNLAPMIAIENIKKSDKEDFELILKIRQRARMFLETTTDETILTDRLPEDLKAVKRSGVLDTKEFVKANSGAG